MQQYVSLREANQHFSRSIDAVQEGNEIIITRRDKPVARLIPANEKRALSSEQRTARKRALTRMRHGYRLGGLRIDRDEIYER